MLIIFIVNLFILINKRYYFINENKREIFFCTSCTGSGSSGWRISNVDETKMKRCTSILMVPLDSLVFFLKNFVDKSVVLNEHTSCRFSKVIDFHTRWIGLVRSRSQISKQNVWRPCDEISDGTWIFHENTLWLQLQKLWINLQDPSAPQSNSFCL